MRPSYYSKRIESLIKEEFDKLLPSLDEIFDSAMDIDGSDAFIKIIKSLTNQNVFIITHKQEIADKLESDKNRIIKFEKIKNFSQII